MLATSVTDSASCCASATGASSGIGAAVAATLAGRGARVFGSGRDAGRLARPGVTPLGADLATGDGAAELAERVLTAAGRVDVVVHNAAGGWAGAFGEIPPETVDQLVAVNLRAPIHLTRALLPGMVRHGGGHLVFVGSIAGRLGVAEEAVYAATKAGLDVFASSLRQELAGSGVTVSVVLPGAVDTAFFTRRGRPYHRRRPRPLPPGRVAERLVAAIEAGRAELYLPGWLRVPVIVRAAFPGAYERLARRFG